MAGRKQTTVLYDVIKTREAVDKYKAEGKPTLAGLCRLLKIRSMTTLREYLNHDDEIGDMVKEAYLYYIEFHETRLATTNSCPNAMFVLKCCSQLGVRFKETDEASTSQAIQSVSLNIKVVEKQNNEPGNGDTTLPTTV